MKCLLCYPCYWRRLLLLFPLLLLAVVVVSWQLLLLSHNSPLATNQRPLVADFLLLPPDPLLLLLPLLLLFTSVCSFSSSPCCAAPHCCCCCFIKSNFAFISFDYCQRFPFFPSIISSRFVLCHKKSGQWQKTVASDGVCYPLSRMRISLVSPIVVVIVVVVPFDACNMHKFPISIKMLRIVDINL